VIADASLRPYLGPVKKVAPLLCRFFNPPPLLSSGRTAGLLVAVVLPLRAAPPANILEFERATVSDGANSIPYRLFRPRVIDKNQKYPLVVFLHGAGERGDDNEAQLRHGLARFSAPEVQAEHPSFILVPQCPKGQKWSDVDWALPKSPLPEQPSVSLSLAMKAVEQLVDTVAVDPKRIYLTGISMGGYGTWDAATRWPERFAAAVPVCGGGDDLLASRLVRIPIWSFHGDLDKAVPVSRSRDMIHAIQLAGGSAKYTEYAGVGHNSWDKAYAETDLYVWLFSQRKSN
jgi:predicted peptidase